MSSPGNRNELAFEMLEEIHEVVVEQSSIVDLFQDTPDGMPRWYPDPGTVAAEVLYLISEHAPITSSKLSDKTQRAQSTTRILSELWIRGFINRRDREGTYHYTGLTEWGEEALERLENRDQQQLGDGCGHLNEPKQPWDDVPFGETKWNMLVAIDKYTGHPDSGDLADKLDMDQTTASGNLTYLHDNGWVGRPEKRPYIYWLTDKGREALA